MTDSDKSAVLHIAVGKGNPAQVALMFWNGVTGKDGLSKSAGIGVWVPSETISCRWPANLHLSPL